jgi:CRP/FNR family cyclic AMP-dependent transcriptional regulator
VIKATSSAIFNPAVFLAEAGLGRRLISLPAKHAFFAQGEMSDCVFYLQSGRVKLTVVSRSGKEATITLAAPGHGDGRDSMHCFEDRARRDGPGAS